MGITFLWTTDFELFCQYKHLNFNFSQMIFFMFFFVEILKLLNGYLTLIYKNKIRKSQYYKIRAFLKSLNFAFFTDMVPHQFKTSTNIYLIS